MTSSDGTASYTYDATGQLIGATYSANPQSLIPNPSESFSYDANGNRTNAGYVVGTGNRLLSDGTYRYAYDAEGNRTAKFIDANEDSLLDAGDTDVTQYAWDVRNRLVEVTHRAAAGGAATQVVDYLYDVEDRWIGESIDTDGDGQFDREIRFAYDGTQIVLAFDSASPLPPGEGQGEGGEGQGEGGACATGSASALTVSDLSHRYLWQPGVTDQLLSDERTALDTAGATSTVEVLWALTDQLGTVRDLALCDSGTTTVVNHIVYESFGTIVSQTDASQGTLFGFTGRPLDTATGLQNNWHRIYDSVTGVWLSKDPLSFTAGDANIARYVGNSPMNATDPTGLEDPMEKVDKRIQDPKGHYEFSVERGNRRDYVFGTSWGHPNDLTSNPMTGFVNWCRDAHHSWAIGSFSQVPDKNGIRVWNYIHGDPAGPAGVCNTPWQGDKNCAGTVDLYLKNLADGTYEVTVQWCVKIVTENDPNGDGTLTCNGNVTVQMLRGGEIGHDLLDNGGC